MKSSRVKRIDRSLLIRSLALGLVMTLLMCMIGFHDFPLNSALGLPPAADWLRNLVGPLMMLSAKLGMWITGHWETTAHFYASLACSFLILWAFAFAGLWILRRIRAR
jgi:hypothetical protein